MTELNLIKVFWGMQLSFIVLKAIGLTEDLIKCSLLWERAVNVVIYIILMLGFCIAYPLLITTAQFSANFAYLNHRKQLKIIFFTI